MVDSLKSDSDNVSTLFDSNVTRGNLKNLVTDKPAPITVALAQKSDGDNVSTLFDSNVTRGNLKNLVTDKPAPITVALAQKGLKPAHAVLLQTLPDGDPSRTITNGGDSVTGMVGNEEVHGAAVVGGTHVTYRQTGSRPLSLEQNESKRITGLYSDDPLPTFNWWDETNRRGQDGSEESLVQRINKLPYNGVEENEPMGMNGITYNGEFIDLTPSKAEQEKFEI
jgi:hypothetical protein